MGAGASYSSTWSWIAGKPQVVEPPSPWRKVHGWGEWFKAKLKTDIKDVDKFQSIYNIALVGQMSAGKSSLVSSFFDVLGDKRVGPGIAAAGKFHSSLTRKFKRYFLQRTIVIADTMGINDETNDTDLNNALDAIEGKVPDGQELTHSCEKSLPDSSIAAHCVGIVVDAHNFHLIKDEVLRKLRELLEFLLRKGIPAVVLLTKVDCLDPEIKENVKKTDYSQSLKNLVDEIHMKFHGIPKKSILPVINYQETAMMDNEMDILLLYALLFMVNGAIGYNDQHLN